MGVFQQGPADAKHEAAGLGRSGPLNGAEIEMATGLTLDDVMLLESDASPDARAMIAAKFATQYDRLNRSRIQQLADDMLRLFARDASRTVRQRFAEAIKTSRRLDPAVALDLANDEIDIATPILEASPVLSDADLQRVILKNPEAYSLVIAGRPALGQATTDFLIEKKGTTRVVCRLLDNAEASLSDDALNWMFEWGKTDPEVSTRLKRRPDLPFEVTQKHVKALGEELNWQAVILNSMSRAEAALLMGQMTGSGRPQLMRSGRRLSQTLEHLQNRRQAGTLTPITIIGFLRDRSIDLVEVALAVLAAVDVRRVRNLLYGSDKRGLVALCLRTGFTTSEYLAFRMVLGMIEISAANQAPAITYDVSTARYAKAQFETMRKHPEQIAAWIGA
jgi:uncharacterized protein (DUF2336 family)